MNAGTLTIVGCGIKFMSHLTIEAKSHIQHAKKLLFLVNEPAMYEWLLSCNKTAESLDYFYTQFNLRAETYTAITNKILENLEKYKSICVVLEGHPVVLAKPALEAVIQAKERGFKCIILPGISTEAYLFADLGIDPGSCGCQSYEATDFLIHGRAFDGFSHLILWQVSVLGMLENKKEHDHKKNTTLLVKYLSKCYPLSHQVIVYEGSQYPFISSTIKKIPLKDLPDVTMSRITTLYIPPLYRSISNRQMLDKLGIVISAN